MFRRSISTRLPQLRSGRATTRSVTSVIALFILLVSVCVSAREVPELAGRVNDYAGMLSAATVSQLETVLAELEASDSTQIVVLTIPSLAGDSLEAFSLQVVERWQIGQRGLDNGALLLIARDDRQLRIEIGYGLEGKLTDLVAGQIIRNIITPHFRMGNFNQGVIDGTAAMIAAVQGEFRAPPGGRSGQPAGNDIGGMITSLLFIFFFFGSMFRRNKALAAAVGGVASPLLAFLLFGITGLLLLALIPAGVVGGLVAAALAGSSAAGRGGMDGYPRSTGGGFGGFGSGSGGFSGGGGGFGGGGASGRW